MNEGGGESPLRIHLGERPRAQLDVAAAPLMRAAGGRRWFLAGNDYVWPRTVNSVARSVLPEHGAIVVGEQHVALGAGDFGPIIEQITATGADIVLNTFVGADGAAFERQCHAMGLCDRTLSLGPAMDEATLERIGERASQGILRCLLPALADRTQRNPAPAVPGQLRPLGTATVDTVRVDLRSDPRLGRAALRIRSTEPRNVADEIRRGHFEVPRGTIALEGNHHGHQQLYLAAAHSATFESMTDATTRH